MSGLSFPTNWGESGEMEFADGKRVVPEYLVTLMGNLDTSQYTYQQALDAVNSGLVGDRLGKAQSSAIKTHFEQARDEHRR